MSYSKMLKVTVTGLLLILFSSQSLYAQSYNDAIEKFNEALELAQAQDFTNAIIQFKETIRIAEEVGSEADEIKTRAEAQIPRLALRNAGGFLRERNFEEGIEALKEAEELATKYGDEENANRARSNLPRAYLQYGNVFYREGDSEKAEEQYRAALEIAPNYATAYYQLGLVHRQMNDLEEALRLFDRSIELSREQNDSESVQRAQNAARDYLVYVGANQIDDRQYNRAVETLRRALRYDENSSEAYYRLSEAYNSMARWSDAISAANNALQYDDSDREERAKIYFELGTAHKNAGNERAACDAFENAAYGDFRDSAAHELDYELDC